MSDAKELDTIALTSDAAAPSTPALPQVTVDYATSAAPTERAVDATIELPSGVDSSASGREASGSLASNAAADPAATLDSAPSADPRAPGGFEGRTVVGYTIEGELGRGGMGVVYKARQAALNRSVALKMVLAGAHAGPEQLARFQTEAEAVAALQHANIVQIYEVGQHEGLPFFSLEFVDGGPLDRRLAGKPQPPKSAAVLLETLARAVHFAHQRGIVHRDLKPSNVLVTADGVPKITDFGLAKKLESDSSQTKSGTLMGTPSYMAPEQARGDLKHVGPAADVYALGAMLYELITGRPPFLAATPLETVMQVMQNEPLPPRKLVPKVPRDLETICLKCLQKEPLRRYATAETLADDLRRFHRGEPVLARRVWVVERGWRWCRRNPRIAALSAAVGVLLVTAAAALSVVGVRAARERQELEETRLHEIDRLEQATREIETGNHGRAMDLLGGADPLLLSAPPLADVRDQRATLREQVALYVEFKSLLDNARYLGLFGARATLSQARDICHRLIALVDQVESGRGRGACGWPPLDAARRKLLSEDVFETFLVAAQVERESSAAGDAAAQKAATEQAIAWLDRAERVLPDLRVLHVRRSGYWEKLGRQDKAAADRSKAAAIQPTSAVDRFWHGQADYMRGEAARAQQQPKAAAEHYQRAIAEYAAVLQMRPEHFWAYFNWATCQFQFGRGHDALVGFTACIHIRPDVPWPYYNRGLIHAQLQQLEAAIGDYTSALDRNAEYAEAFRNRALALLLTKDFAASLVDWKALARLRPRDPESLYYQGVIHLGLRERAAALAALDAAIRLKPDFTSAYVARGELHHWEGRFDAALADINHVLEKLAPNQADFIVERADLYRTMRRWDEAAADYRRAIELDAKQVDALVGLGIALEQSGRADAVAPLYDQMIAANPSAPRGLLRRAELRRDRSEFDAALADCDAVLALDAGSAEAALVRAGVIAAQGRTAEAVAAAERALTGAPRRDGHVLLAAAAAWSLASQAAARQDAAEGLAGKYADRAAALLSDAVGIGFHDLNFQEHNRLADDPALAPLREHAVTAHLFRRGE